MISFKSLISTANKVVSTIYGQGVRLYAGIVKEEELPQITPTKIQISKPKIVFGEEEKIDYTPYIVIGLGIVVILFLARR